MISSSILFSKEASEKSLKLESLEGCFLNLIDVSLEGKKYLILKITLKFPSKSMSLSSYNLGEKINVDFKVSLPSSEDLLGRKYNLTSTNVSMLFLEIQLPIIWLIVQRSLLLVL